jgi:hypothetical protein
VQTETPNIYLVSQQVVGPPTPNHLTKELQSALDCQDHHKSLFYEQLQLYYTNSNQRNLMGRDQLNEIIEIVKGDVTFTKGDAKTATMHYKYRKDFAVMKFGDHYLLVQSKDVVGKTGVDISTIPRYVCYKELYDAIRECHIDQEGHSGIRKMESSTRKHYVNVSRTMCEKFIAACSCQLDRKHPAKPDDIKPIISSSFNSRGQVDLINMTAYKDGPYQWILHYQDHHDKMSYLCAMEDKNQRQ